MAMHWANRQTDQGASSSARTLLAGTITLVYRGVHSRVRHQLAQTQADYLEEVISSQHVFLEDNHSMEVLLIQGQPLRLRALCDALRSVRGVEQLQLFTTTTLLPPLHEQATGTAIQQADAQARHAQVS